MSRTVKRLAAADVEHLAGGLGRLQRQPAGARDVVHADEVALLQPVLEDRRRVVVQEPGREDRQHAGIGIRQRLPRTVGIEEAQRHGGML
jgi:hypothetical protein